MEAKHSPVDIKYLIEMWATNNSGFYDSPRTYSVDPESVHTLLELRMYLSAREANIALYSQERSPSKYFIASDYLGILKRINSQHPDINSSEGLDSAVAYLREKDREFLNQDIEAA